MFKNFSGVELIANCSEVAVKEVFIIFLESMLKDYKAVVNPKGQVMSEVLDGA